MENAESILVIILSVTLTIFLIVGIFLGVVMVQFVRRLNEVADKAQEIIDNVETASEVLKKAAGPLAIGKFMMNIATILKKRKG